MARERPPSSTSPGERNPPAEVFLKHDRERASGRARKTSGEGSLSPWAGGWVVRGEERRGVFKPRPYEKPAPPLLQISQHAPSPFPRPDPLGAIWRKVWSCSLALAFFARPSRPWRRSGPGRSGPWRNLGSAGAISTTCSKKGAASSSLPVRASSAPSLKRRARCRPPADRPPPAPRAPRGPCRCPPLAFRAS